MARLEPLALLVDQRHEGDRHLEDLGGERGDRVEAVFGLRIENAVGFEGEQTLRLVPRTIGLFHA